MIKTKVLSVLITGILIFSACDNRKKTEKQANNEIAAIEQLIVDKSYNKAKIKIDSFHVTYRMLVDKRRIVAALEDTITLRESYRTLQYCDSILPGLTQKFDSVSKYFVFEKNIKYEETGNYVHKFQITENNLNRNLLKPVIDEKAVLKISCIVFGSKISPEVLRISAGDLFVETDSLENNNSIYEFNDGENNIENILFTGNSTGNILKFIYENNKSKIKVTLKGKKELSYYLLPNDVKAVSDAYHLWILKRDIVQLQKQIDEANLKIRTIQTLNKKTNK